MNEASAREVLLLQAFESTVPASPSWGDEDRAWATRLALEGGGAQLGAEAFVALRAHHAMQRLLPREPGLATWMKRHAGRARWGLWTLWVAVAGFGIGLIAHSIDPSQRINLLAPPVWAAVLWNLIVYGLLLASTVMSATRRSPRQPGILLRLAERVMRAGRGLPGSSIRSGTSATAADGSAAALRTFASQWARLDAPVSVTRAAVLLHAGAAALGLGLMAGLYARGLVLDYRAAWESTFLSAGAVHAILSVLLAPASMLSGVALPDSAGFEALRASHGSSTVGAPAAPWIHLYAWTLLLAVVLPRGVLAAVTWLRAHWLVRHVDLPLTDAYFQRLRLQQCGDTAHVQVLPYAQAPSAQAVLGLRTLLTGVLGDALQSTVEPTMPFGAEDDADAWPALQVSTTLVLALFDLTATPEPQNQGRFMEQLVARAPTGASTILLVDEAAFRRRFGSKSDSDSARLKQRRDAWQSTAEAFGSLPVFVNLEAPQGQDFATAQHALQAAITSPAKVQLR